MRSSTMFALLAAVVLGLGVAVTVKATGLLNRAEPKKEAPPTLVLATAINVFEGYCLQSADVRLRPIRPDELRAFQNGELLPAMTQAAVRRFAKVNIPADTALRRDLLEDMTAPPTLKERISPGMEATNVAVPKVHCAGGMISVGDWVNVQLVSEIVNGDGQSTTATALIARNVRVIAKRNSLWPVTAPLAFDAPVNFTLECNPYRAALINYVRDKGMLMLSPISDSDKQALEARRHEVMSQPRIQPVSYNLPESPEFRDEDVRVAAFLQGNYAVGEGDLMRLFQVRYIEPPAPPPPPKRIERFSGVRPVASLEFDHQGEFVGAEPPGQSPKAQGAGSTATTASRTTPSGGRASQSIQRLGSNIQSQMQSFGSGGFQFRPPDPSYCPTCPKTPGSSFSGSQRSQR